MSQSAVERLGQFAQQYNKVVAEKTGSLPQIDHDPRWPSPCEVGNPNESGQIGWKTVKRDTPGDFSQLEAAMAITLHPSVADFYGHYFSGPLPCRVAARDIELLQVWSPDDLERLQQNIIGHLLMQKKLKHSPTVFIGCVHNSEEMVSIDNISGAVVLEVAGNKERQVLSATLAGFLGELTPLAELPPEAPYQPPQQIAAGLLPRLKEIWRSLLGR